MRGRRVPGVDLEDAHLDQRDEARQVVDDEVLADLRLLLDLDPPQRVGRSDRRAPSKASRDSTEDNVDDQESKRRRIEMQNFNSLQEWNTELDRLKESVKLEREMDYPDDLLADLMKELRKHLKTPFVKIVYTETKGPGRTPSSAIPLVQIPVEARSDPSPPVFEDIGRATRPCHLYSCHDGSA